MRKTAFLLLAVIAGITMMACPPLTRAPVTTETGGGGSAPPTPPTPAPPTPPPTPTPQDNEKSWTISAADFRDDGSNRFGPYAWDRITGDNVRVSIGGNQLPFTSTRYQPVFESDFSGAEWTVTPEVSAGAVVLVLTAPNQRRISSREVDDVMITNGGSGYTSVPTVVFSAPSGGGTTATGTAVGPTGVASVTMTTNGNGYSSTSPPTVTFSFGGGGSGAAGTAVVSSTGTVTGVTMTNHGSGYTSAPLVTIALPTSGAQATATATLQTSVTDVTMTNGGRATRLLQPLRLREEGAPVRPARQFSHRPWQQATAGTRTCIGHAKRCTASSFWLR